MVARVRLFGRITASQFHCHLGRNGAEAMASLVSPGRAVARGGHVAAYTIGMLRGTRYGSMASYGVGADIAVATQAKVVGVHGRGELGSCLVDAMACAAADPGFEMLAFSPFRILLPMHLDASTRPPGRHVRFRNRFEMLGSQIIPYLETYWKVPFLVRALPSSVTLAAYIRSSLERQRSWIDNSLEFVLDFCVHVIARGSVTRLTLDTQFGPGELLLVEAHYVALSAFRTPICLFPTIRVVRGPVFGLEVPLGHADPPVAVDVTLFPLDAMR